MACATRLGVSALEPASQGTELAAYLGGSAGRSRGRAARSGFDRLERAVTLGLVRGLVVGKSLGLRHEGHELRSNFGQLALQPRGLTLKVGDDPAVHQLSAVALHRPATFVQHGGETTCPLSELLDVNQPIADVRIAASR